MMFNGGSWGEGSRVLPPMICMNKVRECFHFSFLFLLLEFVRWYFVLFFFDVFFLLFFFCVLGRSTTLFLYSHINFLGIDTRSNKFHVQVVMVVVAVVAIHFDDFIIILKCTCLFVYSTTGQMMIVSLCVYVCPQLSTFVPRQCQNIGFKFEMPYINLHSNRVDTVWLCVYVCVSR